MRERRNEKRNERESQSLDRLPTSLFLTFLLRLAIMSSPLYCEILRVFFLTQRCFFLLF